MVSLFSGIPGSTLLSREAFAAYCSCSICFDVLYEPVTLVCGHTYCSRCIGSVKDKRCPQCRKAWFEWPETNVWIWQLVQQELSEHVERRREEFKQQLTEKTHGEKTWTELTVQEAPIVLDFGRCKQREEEHKQKLLTHKQNQQASCAKRVTIERGPLSFVEF